MAWHHHREGISPHRLANGSGSAGVASVLGELGVASGFPAGDLAGASPADALEGSSWRGIKICEVDLFAVERGEQTRGEFWEQSVVVVCFGKFFRGDPAHLSSHFHPACFQTSIIVLEDVEGAGWSIEGSYSGHCALGKR